MTIFGFEIAIINKNFIFSLFLLIFRGLRNHLTMNRMLHLFWMMEIFGLCAEFKTFPFTAEFQKLLLHSNSEVVDLEIICYFLFLFP